MIVYLCTNLINNKQYIGITSNSLQKRKLVHKYNAITKKSPNHLYRAIRKDGWENFEWAIIEDNIETYSVLLEKEVFYIEKYNTFIRGYNMTIGGDGTLGFKHTEATKKKISDYSRGILKPMSVEHYDKIVTINKLKKGKTYEELYGKDKASKLKQERSEISKKFHILNPEHKNWLSANYDIRYGERSSEIKLKMSLAHKDKLVEGKRVDLTKDGRESLRNSKLKNNNPQYVNIDEDTQKLIEELYKQYGKITSNIESQTGLSKHVIKRFLKEINIYAGRYKYKTGYCNEEI